MTTTPFASRPSARRTPTPLSTALTAFVATVLVLWSPATPAQDGPQLALPRVELTAGMHRIDAQVAQSPSWVSSSLLRYYSRPYAAPSPSPNHVPSSVAVE